MRGWKLHLRDPTIKSAKLEYLSHDRSVFEVCKEGDVDIVKAMLTRTHVDLEARDEYDRTPLHYAALDGHIPVMQYLCEQRADKEARSVARRTPLHLAAQEGHIAVVRYLAL